MVKRETYVVRLALICQRRDGEEADVASARIEDEQTEPRASMPVLVHRSAGDQDDDLGSFSIAVEVLISSSLSQLFSLVSVRDIEVARWAPIEPQA